MLSRRQFLALPLSLLLIRRPGRAEPLVRAAAYHADARVLFGLFSFVLDGSIHEEVDRTAEQYRVVLVGEGPGIRNRIVSEGVIRQRRFVPRSTSLHFSVKGRESRTQITYDYTRRVIDYHHRSQTFLLGRWRVSDDVIRIPAGQALDDAVTVFLNYAEGVLEEEERSSYRTFVVRRARAEREDPDDVQAGGYRADIAPLRVKVLQDPEGGRPMWLLDLTRFSSWAMARHPVRVVFGPSRRPEAISVSLVLGSSIHIGFPSNEGRAGSQVLWAGRQGPLEFRVS